MPNWPPWWEYEVELSPHLLKRMTERGFNETDLREMLDVATDFQPSESPGRFVLSTRHDRRDWEIVIEPDDTEQLLIVVTAYSVT